MLALIAYAKSRRFILRQVKDFFRAPRGENMTVMTETSGEFRFQFFLVGRAVCSSPSSTSSMCRRGSRYVHRRSVSSDRHLRRNHPRLRRLQGGGIFAHGFRLLRPQAQRTMDEVVPLPPCDGRCASSPSSCCKAYFGMAVEATLVCTAAVIVVFKMLAFGAPTSSFSGARALFADFFVLFAHLK